MTQTHKPSTCPKNWRPDLYEAAEGMIDAILANLRVIDAELCLSKQEKKQITRFAAKWCSDYIDEHSNTLEPYP